MRQYQRYIAEAMPELTPVRKITVKLQDAWDKSKFLAFNVFDGLEWLLVDMEAHGYYIAMEAPFTVVGLHPTLEAPRALFPPAP